MMKSVAVGPRKSNKLYSPSTIIRELYLKHDNDASYIDF